MNENNLFKDVKRHLCSWSADLQVAPNLEAILKMPMSELHVPMLVRMDEGSIRARQGG